eukprot:919807-Pyramimonas_sp.AAC.1
MRARARWAAKGQSSRHRSPGGGQDAIARRVRKNRFGLLLASKPACGPSWRPTPRLQRRSQGGRRKRLRP